MAAAHQAKVNHWSPRSSTQSQGQRWCLSALLRVIESNIHDYLARQPKPHTIVYLRENAL